MDGRKISYHAVATKLNDNGFRTSLGYKFTAVQVRRLALKSAAI
jgi:hypothetical protein